MQPYRPSRVVRALTGGSAGLLVAALGGGLFAWLTSSPEGSEGGWWWISAAFYTVVSSLVLVPIGAILAARNPRTPTAASSPKT